MLINKTKMFPYPMLWSETDDYLNSYFRFEYTGYRKQGAKIIFECFVELNDKYIVDLINSNKAKMFLHIENSKTKFRDKVSIDIGNNEFSIDSYKINGKIEFCPVVVLINDMDYSNDNFNTHFKNMNFKLPEGTIIAIGDAYTEVIEKETTDISKLKSIISVIRHEDDSFKGFDVSCDRKEKIYVKLPEKLYLSYSKISLKNDSKNTIFSMIIIPAIEYSLNYLKENIRNDYDLEEYADYRWYQVLMKKIIELYKLKKIDLDFISNMQVLEIAQKIMDYPLEEALKEINGGE